MKAFLSFDFLEELVKMLLSANFGWRLAEGKHPAERLFFSRMPTTDGRTGRPLLNNERFSFVH